MRKPRQRSTPDAAATTLLARIDARSTAIDVVVLSDYAKGVLSDAVLARVLALAAAHESHW